MEKTEIKSILQHPEFYRATDNAANFSLWAEILDKRQAKAFCALGAKIVNGEAHLEICLLQNMAPDELADILISYGVKLKQQAFPVIK